MRWVHNAADEMKSWRHVVPCPKCNAPPGCPCADFRSHDRDLFGNRVHDERRRLARLSTRPDATT